VPQRPDSALPAIALPRPLASKGYGLRPARSSDRDFERRLFESARPDAAVLAGWPAATRGAFLDQQFQFQTAHYAGEYPHAERLIVTAKGAPVGRLIVERAGLPWQIVDIALLPSSRRRGLGGALLDAVLAAAACAAAEVALTVEQDNPARGLYERFGFTVTAIAPPHLAMLWRPLRGVGSMQDRPAGDETRPGDGTP